ncbi:4'-phosphopantetheinyl transferase family protein [Kitasatospora sp. McL0602]|uniref:4'-phosphopantetheinyl transferase family protein n=1 Tax=Kitasatospora sp. McL0602 TaxID=3439530 RepID=UPI003F8A8DC8
MSTDPRPAGLFARLLPPTVAVAESFHDELPGRLYPAEEAVIAQAVASRRHEFTTGRLCARLALTRLGLPPTPIPTGPSGEPCWPDGTLGSITHCPGFRAAAVTSTGRATALGIDAEPDHPLPADLLDSVASPTEQALLRALERSAHQPVNWGQLLFSAKESVYKAWYPQGQRVLEFSEAEVTLHPDGHFSARLLLPSAEREQGLRTEYSGRWLAQHGLLLTAVHH